MSKATWSAPASAAGIWTSTHDDLTRLDAVIARCVAAGLHARAVELLTIRAGLVRTANRLVAMLNAGMVP